uniref:Uncharacterized protein n=1 Tax=Candidatus Kentrum sp. FW TaxID=2126338 RepID=A0A450STY7_9GAMM|nr:MAG: hypothetical protein BECKFW1821B_GA0114236_103421 [Candidatus Kentron sp. FW]
MRKCYEWTYYLETKGPGYQYYDEVFRRSEISSWFEKIRLKKFLRPYIDPRFSFSYYFNLYMKKVGKNLKKPTKYYTYIE